MLDYLCVCDCNKVRIAHKVTTLSYNAVADPGVGGYVCVWGGGLSTPT